MRELWGAGLLVGMMVWGAAALASAEDQESQAAPPPAEEIAAPVPETPSADVDRLATRILELLASSRGAEPLSERSIAELMVSPELYPKLYGDQSVAEAFDGLAALFFGEGNGDVALHGIRSALIFSRSEEFLGMLRFSNLLRLVLPDYLGASPYSSFFTGMFLAQCKVIGQRRFAEIMDEAVTVDVDAPLLRAVHLMVSRHQISLPVVDHGRLVGILRDRAVVLEMSHSMRMGR